jgi:hypothetical protein
MTMEQTIQARRLRCCPGGTKFSVIVRLWERARCRPGVVESVSIKEGC